MRSPSPEYEDGLRRKLGQPSRVEEQVIAPHSHWNTDGDLVVERKTLFRQVGWICRGDLEPMSTEHTEGAPFSPVYQQIATWVEGEGWDD